MMTKRWVVVSLAVVCGACNDATTQKVCSAVDNPELAKSILDEVAVDLGKLFDSAAKDDAAAATCPAGGTASIDLSAGKASFSACKIGRVTLDGSVSSTIVRAAGRTIVEVKGTLNVTGLCNAPINFSKFHLEHSPAGTCYQAVVGSWDLAGGTTACGGAPDARVDAGSPDASRPDAAMPDAARPDLAAPDAARPDATKPDAQLGPLFFGPTPYLKKADTPAGFAPATWSYHHVEDVEDHKINTPGLSSPAGSLSSSFGASLIDSVDEDDGNATNGTCTSCDAWWGGGSLTFAFDEKVLGKLPTRVGLVWTDGAGSVTFEAFGPAGSYGKRTGTGFPDSDFNGKTAEDRFFGVVAPDGVTKVIISNSAGGVEADHVQYGREP
ncbi:MAG: hypothetical protein IT371_20090 [Deltaproteobacteria bacterium]|nr:hypothetical protein [Deltaproteobacteria bacterium]